MSWPQQGRYPQFTLASWHRPVRGGMWTSSVEERLGLEHDSLKAMLHLSVKEQSMQMSALGYPDEVCMIPEEEW